jgi:lipopolysaccharide heptosyltransferase II
LIVRLGAIGDVANALVLATAIKDRDPSVEIGWAVHDLARPLVEDHPSVDRVHVWSRGGGWRELARWIDDVRERGYELAIDLQRIWKSAVLARLSGAGRVLAFDAPRSKEASSLFAGERIAASSSRHMVDWYLDFARHLGIRDARARFVLPSDSQAARRVEAWRSGSSAALVAIHVGATKPANRWAPERFGELARLLSERARVDVALIGGPDERAIAERALASARGAPIRDLVGRTSLIELVELLRRARLAISCDSGPMHLAAAVETPVLALFGAADPERTGPYGTRHRVLRTRPFCSPCNRRDCNQPRHACMEDLSVDIVLDAALAMLAD